MNFWLFPGILFFIVTIMGVGFYNRSKGWDDGYRQSSEDADATRRDEVDHLLGRDH